MKTVAITGASGSMGSQTLYHIMQSPMNFKSMVVLRDKPRNRRLAFELKKRYGGRVEIVMGDISDDKVCAYLAEKADYILHCSAIIPPNSDHDPEGAKKSNYFGTVRLVDAIKASGRADNIKFVNVATVALYGNRSYKHPWARVGDPLIPSSYDYYAATKLMAERYVLDAELPCFISLRQTAILHHNLFINNMKDGLMFHTCWNTPLEWVTASDSGILMRHLVEYDTDGTLPKEFWNKCYNIGGGAGCRCTGFETFDAGFKLMGASVKDFIKPNWHVIRNFHGTWFYDSDVLENYLHFQNESNEDFWKQMARLNWYYKLGVVVPKPLLSKLAIQRLFNNTNAPKYWLKNKHEGRIKAFYGSIEKYEQIGEDWSKFPLLCEGKTPCGDIDYEELKNPALVKEKGLLLDHGYDETKPDCELDINDMKQAAAFRGGKCVSNTMVKGDLYTKLVWECHDGHRFEASPYTILKAGHWCPKCCLPPPWGWGELAKHIPFFAQVYYDDFDACEIDVFPLKEGEDDFLISKNI